MLWWTSSTGSATGHKDRRDGKRIGHVGPRGRS